jgi:hypothetical protein
VRCPAAPLRLSGLLPLLASQASGTESAANDGSLGTGLSTLLKMLSGWGKFEKEFLLHVEEQRCFLSNLINISEAT